MLPVLPQQPKSSRRCRVALTAAVVFVMLGVAGPATAQPLVPKWQSDVAVDVTVTSVAVSAAALMMFWPVDLTSPWGDELLPPDQGVRGRFSPWAAHVSDGLLATTASVPVAALAGAGFDDRYAEAGLIYSEALAVNLALNHVVKYLVGRPRPYSYHASPQAQALVARAGSDVRLSFYSGHASTAFASAVAGSLMFAMSSHDIPARAALWATELGLAAATANLRVRAGRHYYSDVVVGALVGAGVGALVAGAHATGRAYEPTPGEWLAMALGLSTGVLLSELVPVLDPPNDTGKSP